MYFRDYNFLMSSTFKLLVFRNRNILIILFRVLIKVVPLLKLLIVAFIKVRYAPTKIFFGLLFFQFLILYTPKWQWYWKPCSQAFIIEFVHEIRLKIHGAMVCQSLVIPCRPNSDPIHKSAGSSMGEVKPPAPHPLRRVRMGLGS